MKASFLESLIGAIRLAFLAGGIPGSHARLTVRFQVEEGSDGSMMLRPASPAESAAQVLEVEIAGRKPEPRVAPRQPGTQAGSPPPEAGTGGDPATLGRRLELILGGPPGFGTGARAEVLSDLLQEFGRAALVERLQRDWISQFDTGPDSSAAVIKPPGTGPGTPLPPDRGGA